jgi:hypothetical protein
LTTRAPSKLAQRRRQGAVSLGRDLEVEIYPGYFDTGHLIHDALSAFEPVNQ